MSSLLHAIPFANRSSRRRSFALPRIVASPLFRAVVWVVMAMLSAALLGCSGGGTTINAGTPDCAALLQASIANTTVTAATIIPAGTDLKAITGTSGTLAAPTCRVVATVSTQPGEHIGIEVWLPQTGWNGRLLGVGSGGFGGSIFYQELTPAVARGFVAAATDTGHVGGTSGAIGQRLAWASDPVQLSDWGHTSIHWMTLAAKDIIRTYYGHDVGHSYYEGCSTGGAEAMEEVEYYPNDYDGVHAGSPGMAYSHLMESFLWGALLPAKQPASLLTPAALALLNDTVLASCGGTTATQDGFLANPLTCSVDITPLQCKSGQDPGTCLSSAQISQAQRLYSAVLDSRNGKQLYPGFAYGSERQWTSIQGALVPNYAQPLLANAVFDNPNWDWTSFDFGADADLVDAKLTPSINATSPDLSSFQKRGGKLIMTQGWSDSLNAQTLPIEYFENVVQQQGGLAQTQNFYRLVMVPGMDHCGGGPGANSIGGSVPPVQIDSSRDVVSALQSWVEQGVAPQSFVSTKYVNDTPASGVAFERPVCVYPAYPQYNGTGDRRSASSFQCVTGPRGAPSGL
ncbi:tannase/feruloyl esterase family alpha/beta hydrolase [Paraburkholderia sp.]|uniref:tannase/feruloyl esterase family alpha/beta hydrolase n=1 Tax=Paraburkholderia sp. TaxID=1926495 RepID=UPI003D6E868C